MLGSVPQPEDPHGRVSDGPDPTHLDSSNENERLLSLSVAIYVLYVEVTPVERC
jgi:hypothetical protein